MEKTHAINFSGGSPRYGRSLFILVTLVTPFYGWTLAWIAGLPLLRPDLLVLGVLVSYAVLLIASSRRIRLDLPSVLLVLWIAQTTVMSAYTAFYFGRFPETITAYAQLLLLVLFYVSSKNIAVTGPGLLVILRTWVLSAVTIAGFGFYQGLARVFGLPGAYLVFNIPQQGTEQRVGYESAYPPMVRVASVFAEPSWYGAYLVPPAILCLVLLLSGKERILLRTRKSLLLVTMLLFVGVIQSLSGTAYVAMGLAIGVFILPLLGYLNIHKNRYIAVYVGAIVVAVFSLPVVRQVLFELFELPVELLVWWQTGNMDTVTFGSAQYRVRNNYNVVKLWATSPPVTKAFGLGINSLEGNPQTAGNYSSNSYLQILIDGGLLGVLMFVGFLLKLCKKTLVVSNRFRDRNNAFSSVGYGLTGAVVATSFLLLQSGYLRPVRWLAFVFTGLYLGAAAQEDCASNDGPETIDQI